MSWCVHYFVHLSLLFNANSSPVATTCFTVHMTLDLEFGSYLVSQFTLLSFCYKNAVIYNAIQSNKRRALLFNVLFDRTEHLLETL